MPTADTSSHPGYVWISLRAICFSSSIDISVLFIRVLRFHVIAARQLVATVSLRKRGRRTASPTSRVQILSGHYNTRGQSDPPAATSRERDVRSRLGALQR